MTRAWLVWGFHDYKWSIVFDEPDAGQFERVVPIAYTELTNGAPTPC